jgi:hypothetical protein
MAPLQRYRNVPICIGDGPLASGLLAFAEWPLLAKSGHVSHDVGFSADYVRYRG